MKKVYTSTFKAQVVLELFKDLKTVPQLAAEYGIAPTVLREWKAAALKGLPEVFSTRDSSVAMQAAYEQQLEARSSEIGRLTTHVNFLKKSCPVAPYGATGVGRNRP